MFFRRKGWLRQEFDERLVHQINHLKKEWDHHNHLQDNSFDPFGNVNMQVKVSGIKYVYLLREAKKRQISVLK